MKIINNAWEIYSNNRTKENLEILSEAITPMIVSSIKKYYGIEPFADDDLLIEGYIGFLNAIRLYVGTNNSTFSTYAFIKINGAILDALRRWRKSKGIRECAMSSNGEILKIKSRVSLKNKNEHKKFIYPKYIKVEDIDKSNRETYRQDNFIKKIETKDYLDFIFKHMTKKHINILKLKFYDNKTYKEIGLMMNITSSRVCQLVNEALSVAKSISDSTK